MRSRWSRCGTLTLLLACAAALAATAQSTEVLAKPSGPPRVLVLPEPSATARTALMAHPGVLVVKTAGAGIGTLEGLLQDASVVETLRSGPWDFVVVQGHATFGRTLVIDGEVRVGDPSDFLHHGRLLLDAVRNAGARPILLVPPRSPGAPAVDQETVEWAYNRLAREGGALLAPVGEAFSRLRRRRPSVALFDPSGSAWTATGAALAAATLETTITGRPPTPGPPAIGSSAPADELNAETRQVLNRAAWEAVRDLAAHGGSRDLAEPPFPPVPTLAPGEPMRVADLGGRWRGPIRLYPWPATLELEVNPSSEGLRVKGRIDFEAGRHDLTFEATGPQLETNVLSFRNPSDLAGGRTLYQLVSRGDRLVGVAELVTDHDEAYAIGSFELSPMSPDPAVETHRPPMDERPRATQRETQR